MNLAIARNSSWYLLEKLIRLSGSFLVSAWVARYLGPHEYGTLAFAMALIALAAFLVSLGVEGIVVRDLVQEPERESEILSTYFSLRVLGGILGPALACAYVLAMGINQDGLLAVTAVLGVGTFLTTMDLTDCALQARHQARRTSSIRAIAFTVASLLKCVLVLTGAHLLWFAVATIVEYMLTAVMYGWILRSMGVHLSWRRFDPREMRTFLLDGKYMILSGAAVAVYSRIDVIAIGSVISKSVLANYALAAAMVAAWNLLGVSFAQALAPHVAAAHSKSSTEYIRILRRFLLATLVISVAGSAVISLCAHFIFWLLLGPSYALGGEILQILIWSAVASFMGVATSQIIINERLYALSLIRSLMGLVPLVIFIYPVAVQWGVFGVTWLVVVSYILGAGSILLSSRARSVLKDVVFRREGLIQ